MCNPCNLSCDYYISPRVIEFWNERGKQWGTIASGALFGAGWWFWVDAVCTNSHKIPFDQVTLDQTPRRLLNAYA